MHSLNLQLPPRLPRIHPTGLTRTPLVTSYFGVWGTAFPLLDFLSCDQFVHHAFSFVLLCQCVTQGAFCVTVVRDVSFPTRRYKRIGQPYRPLVHSIHRLLGLIRMPFDDFDLSSRIQASREVTQNRKHERTLVGDKGYVREGSR